MWDHNGDFSKQHCLLFILFHVLLQILIFIDTVVGYPGHSKDLADGMNWIDKCMLRVYMSKLLNTSSIHDNPRF